MSSVPPPLPELPGLSDGAPPSPIDPPLPPFATSGDSGDLQPGWVPWLAPLALVTAFAFAIFGAIAIGAVSAIFGGSFEDPAPAANIAATVLQDAAFIGAALWFARRAGRVLPVQFGLRITPLWSGIGWAALTMLAFYVFSGLWAALLDPSASDTLPKSFGVHESTAALVAVCIVVTVVAPIAEELFFRGFFFTALRNWRGPWLAAVLTGVVFGGIHAGSAPVVFLVPLGVLGFLLCLLRWRTGSLLPCMAVHAFNNAVAFAVGELEWGVGPTLLLIVGAVGAVLLLALPFTQASRMTPAR